MVKKEKSTEKGMRTGYFLILVIIMTILSLSGCGLPFFGKNGEESNPSEPERVDTGFVLTGPDSFDSADTAILVNRNEEEDTLTFLNLELGRKYTLSMDGTTRLYDRYGEAVTVGQFEKGDIVDITFLKTKKHLTTMQLSGQAWVYEDVQWYEMNTAKGEVTIGSDLYKLTSNTQYLSAGRSIEPMDLNAADVLSFQGIDKQVLTVRVEKGHGYLRLKNDENFVGGWIEIGQSIIQRITEDMLLTVPEGSYEVNISNKGGGGVKNVVIRRNEESMLDIGDLEIPEPQKGIVLFSLSPSDAELYIDGDKVDASGPITLEYGLHQFIARASGYQSITQYIRVAQESTGVNVVLETLGSGAGTESSSASSGSTSTDTLDDYYKVYVDAPAGAEVYLDGNYVGVSPCSFKKVEGVRVITLRKSGYETRSYTVNIDNAEKDLSYSFADLVKQEDSSKESSSGQSGESESSTSSGTSGRE